MACVQVFWTERGEDFDEDSEYAIDELREVHTGVLTDDPDQAAGETPVVVEDETGRVYLPDDFRPDTILYVESPPGTLPGIAEAAQEAGFHLANAEARGLTGPEVAPPLDEDIVDPRTE